MHVSSNARRYGRALAKVAISHRKEKTVGEEIAGISAYFRDNALPRLVLESPASSAVQQDRLLSALESAVDFSPFTKNFLRLLVEGGRFRLLGEIAEAYRQEVDAYHGVVEVGVTTASPLADAERDALKGTLARALAGGKQVRLEVHVDPSLVAGLSTRIGSVVYDGSLDHQLHQLRQQLVSES